MGSEGLERVALTCHEQTQLLLEKLTAITGVEAVFTSPFFHETVIRLSQPIDKVLAQLAQQHILGGYALGQHYPHLQDCLLICATEMRSATQIEDYALALQQLLNAAA